MALDEKTLQEISDKSSRWHDEDDESLAPVGRHAASHLSYQTSDYDDEDTATYRREEEHAWHDTEEDELPRREERRTPMDAESLGVRVHTEPVESKRDVRSDDEVRQDAKPRSDSGLFRNLMAAVPHAGEKVNMTRAERRAAKRAFAKDMKAAQRAAKKAEGELKQIEAKEKKKNASIAKQVRERERELSDRTDGQREKRKRAKGVYDAIAFDRMFENGICEVEDGLYSESIEFEDVSYQSALESAQLGTFEAMKTLLDYFSSDTTVQYTILNTPLREEEIGDRRFFNPDACGENAALADQFNGILNDKMREGCSNIVRQRIITYSTAAENPDRAYQLLARIRAQVTATLDQVKSHGHVMNGTERLKVISSLLKPGSPFDFHYGKLSVKSPLTAKDFICPMSLDFHATGGDDTCYKSDDMWCQVLVMSPNFSSELMDRCISNVLDLPIPMAVSWHLQPIDKAKAVNMIKRQTAWIQKEVIDNQRKALRDGYDYSILPPELQDTKSENEKVLNHIQHANQRLYYFSGCIMTYAPTRDELNSQVIDLIRTCHSQGIELMTLNLRQREGMNSVLPLGHNHVNVQRDFTTTEACIMMPFTTQELDMPGGGYYGQNRLSSNLVICNRKRLLSPHGFVCGMSGSGKSFSVKREIVNTILSYPKDEIYIMDVTGEYSYLVRMTHGLEYAFGPDSDTFLNPFDMADVSDLSYQAALTGKLDSLLAMTSALKAEGGDDLTQEERSVIATCVERIYDRADRDGRVPLLQDLQQALNDFDGVGSHEAKRLALVFSRYVSGPMSFLNHESNVDFGRNRITSFNTKEVPADMRVFTMLANLESVRQRMFVNHQRGVTTWLYIDEIQSLFGHEAIIRMLGRLWREGRKYGLVATGMTQSAAVMARNAEASAIVDQSGFLYLLRQAPADREFWTMAKQLSQQESDAIGDTTKRGSGLLIADGARVPFMDDFPSGNDLFDMFSTSPEDYARLLERERLQNKDRSRKA